MLIAVRAKRTASNLCRWAKANENARECAQAQAKTLPVERTFVLVATKKVIKDNLWQVDEGGKIRPIHLRDAFDCGRVNLQLLNSP